MSDEFDIIRRYFGGFDRGDQVITGIGDDAAVLAVNGRLAVATDTLLPDVHFPGSADAAAIGRRSLAVNLSDLAAMGADPLAFTLALTVPDADSDWLDRFSTGLGQLASDVGIPLVGGDLTRGPLTVTIQVLGTLPEGGYLTRAGATAGDQVLVSGQLGAASAALAQLDKDPEGDLNLAWQARLLAPEARLALGRRLVGIASSAIDISDGLLADLGHICEASGCGATVFAENVPIAAGISDEFGGEQALRWGLTGGDDYELCFTVPQELASLIPQIATGLKLPLTVIGEMNEGAGVVCTREGQPLEYDDVGYQHFKAT